MALTSILLHLADDPRNQARIEASAELARRHEAHLAGLYVITPPRWPSGGEAMIPESLREKLAGDLRERANKTRAEFENACRKQGVSGEWRLAEGYAADIVAEQARYSDVVVVGQPGDEPPIGTEGLVDELVFSTGRPVLVVPYAGRYATFGKRVLVAWKGGREAARAVSDAIPFMKKADLVTVLTINAKGAGHIPGQDIAAFLARHGVKTELRQTVARDIEVGDVLLSSAADMGADLLVMGAYSHSRLREMVMGGATRSIIERMTLPTVFSH
ncbi:MAG: universal stress protein [Alphaproteobacteria bacterium]|nr:universal stress protein [Alphaproteobacteria bacterium]